MATKHSGQLELTWTDKDKALLSTGDGKYDYTFVDPADYRVNEVRLLHEVDSHSVEVPEGFELPFEPTSDNLLITGDAMHVLDSLRMIPEFADKYVGNVKLVYIDPPFNTGLTFTHYEDNISHSIWLTMLRDRIVQIMPLLSPEGSIWIHLDDTEVHRCRCVLDEVLGIENFVAQVVWQKVYKLESRTDISIDTDTILVYKASSKWAPNKMDRVADPRYGRVDGDERMWRGANLPAPGATSHQGQVYAIQHPFSGELLYPPLGSCWRWGTEKIMQVMSEWGEYEWKDLNDTERRAQICGVPPNKVRPDVPGLMLSTPLDDAADFAERRYAQGKWPELYFGRKADGGIQRKQYMPGTGRPPQNLWLHTEVGHNTESNSELKALFPDITPFSTPKPERLLQRIVQIATNPGDIVLDCFAGSGTTAAVAQKMGRRWVTSELSSQTVKTFTKPRLLKVIHGEDTGGVSTSVNRVATDEVDLPKGVTPEQAQKFTAHLKKFSDDLEVSIDVAKQTAKAVRAQVKEGTSPLSDEEQKTLIRLLNKVSKSENEGLVVNLMPDAVKAMRAAAKTRDETTVNWMGGGGFTHLEVGPSMFESSDGWVYLADWATNGALTDAMCAQLGIRHEPDGIFAGSKGKVRFVILDGMVTVSTIDAILDQLRTDEIVEVWATQVDTDAEERLRKARPGSKLATIPASVLDGYRRKAAKQSPFKPAQPNGEQS